MSNKIFIQYKELDNFGKEKIVSGYFELLKETDFEIKIRSQRNTLTIPKSMLLKMKDTNNYKGGTNK